MKWFYFYLVHLLPTFEINSLFFFKCYNLCEFSLKKFYFPLEGIQKALKTQRKIYMTNWKVRKETVIDLFSLRVKKELGGERKGEEGGAKKRGERKKSYICPLDFLIPTYFFNYGNNKDSFNWLCEVSVLRISEAINLEAISS